MCTANSSLSLKNQIIDSPGLVQSFDYEAADLTLAELCLHFRPSCRAYPAHIGLHTLFNVKRIFILVVLQEAISYEILLHSFTSSNLISSQFTEIADFSMLRKYSFSFGTKLLHNIECRLDFLLFQHIATGLTVLVRTCDERVSELFGQSGKFRMGSHLSLSCVNSSEASVPKI